MIIIVYFALFFTSLVASTEELKPVCHVTYNKVAYPVYESCLFMIETVLPQALKKRKKTHTEETTYCYKDKMGKVFHATIPKKEDDLVHIRLSLPDGQKNALLQKEFRDVSTTLHLFATEKMRSFNDFAFNVDPTFPYNKETAAYQLTIKSALLKKIQDHRSSIIEIWHV